MSKDESRRFPRMPSQNAVLVKETSEGGGEAFVPTRTLSYGGCSFLSQVALEPKSILELLISVDHRVITARATVVYSRLGEDSRYEVGVEFLEVNPKDREVLAGLLGEP
jgi:c-di-GMP-binding flagellar brake protein YcgR